MRVICIGNNSCTCAALRRGTRSIDTLKWAGPLAVAVAALILPWLGAFWNKYVRQASIDVYETANIDVGYSTVGSTIGLQGTLRALHHDQFIRSIKLTVTRNSDGARHHFEWAGFRTLSTVIPGSTSGNTPVEWPAGFMLTTAEPRRFNIVFADRDLERQMRTILDPLQQEWQSALLGAWGGTIPPQLDAAQFRAGSEAAYATFASKQQYLDAYTELDRICYWTAGRFALEMLVETARPSRSFSNCWEFELGSDDTNRLRLNRINILQITCSQDTSAYNFAFVNYVSQSGPIRG